MRKDRNSAILVVLFCAAMWGFWWFPVALFENAGLAGPWIGMAMSASALPVAAIWALTQRGAMSPRAIAGSLLVGLAVTLYAMAASYTDFIRAVLLFYLAPAWSTLIELAFFGRRFTIRTFVAILCSLIGIVLISRGEISFEGLGAVGDWMALGSGLSWSVGIAFVFAARAAEVSRVTVITALGGMASALVIAALDGSVAAGVPDFGAVFAGAPGTFLFGAAYVGIILAGTMWGAFRLPPAVMTYLLSVEILGGVLSSALILGEAFGWFEFGGAFFIVAAVLVEVLWPSGTEKSKASAVR